MTVVYSSQQGFAQRRLWIVTERAFRRQGKVKNHRQKSCLVWSCYHNSGAEMKFMTLYAKVWLYSSGVGASKNICEWIHLNKRDLQISHGKNSNYYDMCLLKLFFFLYLFWNSLLNPSYPLEWLFFLFKTFFSSGLWYALLLWASWGFAYITSVTIPT